MREEKEDISVDLITNYYKQKNIAYKKTKDQYNKSDILIQQKVEVKQRDSYYFRRYSGEGFMFEKLKYDSGINIYFNIFNFLLDFTLIVKWDLSDIKIDWEEKYCNDKTIYSLDRTNQNKIKKEITFLKLEDATLMDKNFNILTLDEVNIKMEEVEVERKKLRYL